MYSLQLKKAIFYEDRMVYFHKKGDITINLCDIDRIEYKKRSLINYFLVSGFFAGGTYPGRLEIYLKKKIGRTRLYLVSIKNSDYLRLPDGFRKLIGPELI